MTTLAHAPSFLARFSCLGADCEDTCCKGWNMQVDVATRERYAREAPELMEAVTGEPDDTIMRRDARTDYCVKFEGGLCGIQLAKGPDFLGDACYFYPRVTRALGDVTVQTAALSCPEIARLALLGDDAFITATVPIERRLSQMQNYLPGTLTSEQAMGIHQAFITAALDESASPERIMMRLFCVSESLMKIAVGSWPDAVSFYLQQADTRLMPPEPRETDPAYLLQALCGLVAATRKVHHARLMQTIGEMERALHLSIRWDTLAIAPLPDSAHAITALHARWKKEWQAGYAKLLKRYIATQLSVALFPFAGFGTTLAERAAIIAIRFATVRLALMSITQAASGAPAETDVIRVVQSLSRFLDHLAAPEFSLQIYRETGWLSHQRLRALLGDAA